MQPTRERKSILKGKIPQCQAQQLPTCPVSAVSKEALCAPVVDRWRSPRESISRRFSLIRNRSATMNPVEQGFYDHLMQVREETGIMRDESK